MLVFLALGNAKVLYFASDDAKVPNANIFASQWNIGLKCGNLFRGYSTSAANQGELLLLILVQ